LVHFFSQPVRTFRKTPAFPSDLFFSASFPLFLSPQFSPLIAERPPRPGAPHLHAPTPLFPPPHSSKAACHHPNSVGFPPFEVPGSHPFASTRTSPFCILDSIRLGFGCKLFFLSQDDTIVFPRPGRFSAAPLVTFVFLRITWLHSPLDFPPTHSPRVSMVWPPCFYFLLLPPHCGAAVNGV